VLFKEVKALSLLHRLGLRDVVGGRAEMETKKGNKMWRYERNVDVGTI